MSAHRGVSRHLEGATRLNALHRSIANGGSSWPSVECRLRTVQHLMPRLQAPQARVQSGRRPQAEMAPPDCTQMMQWIRENGGYIHESLCVSDSAPCGSRGVVASLQISAEEAAASPLVAIPCGFELTDDVATRSLLPLLPHDAASDLSNLDSGALVMLGLAYELSIGDKSGFAPYIASLPSHLPCPWSWGDQQAQAALAGMNGGGSPGWMREVGKARRYAESVSRGLWQDFGQHVGISQEELTWALGIVTSRGYGGDQRPCLIPFIDLFNHDARAPPFLLQTLEVEMDGDGDSEASESGRPTTRNFYTVWATSSGKPRQLGAGDEVYVDYSIGAVSPLDIFLSHGFLPPEKWQ
mmetsp:Transcript_23858/g.66173  ORF Transcript_23858/g.66173 Transcript_23858/m.66173 type:complete len:354 (-) Transcript_23858:707-1768(-)